MGSGKASRSCWTTQSADGCRVTLRCRILRVDASPVKSAPCAMFHRFLLRAQPIIFGRCAVPERSRMEGGWTGERSWNFSNRFDESTNKAGERRWDSPPNGATSAGQRDSTRTEEGRAGAS